MLAEELLISIVIPVHNEAGNILPLAQEIDAVLSPSGWRYEVLWVDDGSTDDTAQCVNELQAKNPVHLLVPLPYHIGQSAALWTGFQTSRGEILVTLDGDGQNEPRDIHKLVEKVMSGETHAANGYREFRQDSWQRRRGWYLHIHDIVMPFRQ